jgi:hypothetical protein
MPSSKAMYRMTLVALALLVACGDNERPELAPDAHHVDAALIDAGVDAAPLPSFEGRFDELGEFTRFDCTAGSLAGFAANAVWSGVPLRTAAEGGSLATYLSNGTNEHRVEPLVHTDDDLLVREDQGFRLVAVHVCGVTDGARIRGSVAECFLIPEAPNGLHCNEWPFDEEPITRLPGESEGEHLSLLGEIGADWLDASTGVRVRGTMAYVSTLTDGVHIVDVANPAQPVERGHLAQPDEYANDIELTTGTDGRLYAITASSPCNVMDVTDPTAPALVAQLPFAAHTLWINDGVAYLASGSSSTLDMWNVANPRAPVHLAMWTHPEGNHTYTWHDLTVIDGLAYLAEQFGGNVSGTGVHVVDVSDPQRVQLVARETGAVFGSHTTSVTTNTAGRRLVVESSEFAGEGLRILDGAVGRPGFLDHLGSWVLRPDTVPMHEVTAIGDRVYVSHYQDGVRVLDISDPTTPVQVGYFNTWDPEHAIAGWNGAFAIEVDPVTKRIYVADANRGLVILEGDEVVFPLSSP